MAFQTSGYKREMILVSGRYEEGGLKEVTSKNRAKSFRKSLQNGYIISLHNPLKSINATILQRNRCLYRLR